MAYNKHLHDNFEVNFSLKGITSILIGIYFFLLSYAYNYVLTNFLVDDHTLGMLSPQIIEIIFISLAGVFILFFSLALFFSGKRTSKNFHLLLWNGKTKVAFFKYLIGIALLFILLITLMKFGLVNLIAPGFLFIYGIFLLLIKNKARKNILILSALSLLLSIYCFVIPSYWYSSFTILALAHAAYGVVER